MIFHNKNKVIHSTPNIKLFNHSVDKVQNFNFLGVNLNENLNWKNTLIAYIYYRCIGTLCRTISSNLYFKSLIIV